MPFATPSEMTTENIKSEILLWVATLAQWLSRDTASFWYVKRLSKIEEYGGLGGGNMVIGLGCVSSLEFYGGVHSHLTDKQGLWTERDLGAYQSVIEEAHSLGLSRSKLDIIARPVPVVGTLKNACQAVRGLVMAIEQETSLQTGLPVNNGKDFCTLWNSFRNNLAHTMSPALGTSVASVGPEVIRNLKIRSSKFKKGLYLNPGPAFNICNRDGIDRWEFNADVFAMGYIIQAANFIRDETSRCSDRTILVETLEFIRGKPLPDSLLRGSSSV